MTFGSLFSGIGGMDLGLERAGMVCRWQVEIDDFCRRVLAKHWPNVPKYGDIRDITGDELERVDLMAGGFPCQPVSLAGKRGAQADERWLWPEFARVVRLLRPQYALLENVPGLLTAGMGDVLGDLAALGYDAEWSLLSACAMGAPHTRERLFLVAYANRKLGEARLRVLSEHHRQGQILQARHRERQARWLDTCCCARGSVDGLPARVDRVRTLGNAVVPACAEYIGRLILQHVAE